MHEPIKLLLTDYQLLLLFNLVDDARDALPMRTRTERRLAQPLDDLRRVIIDALPDDDDED